MTTNQMKLFRLIMGDATARKKVSDATSVSECETTIVNLGERFGAPVTREEVRSILEMEVSEELNDFDLESVVGGKPNQWGTDEDDVLEGTTFYYIFTGDHIHNDDHIVAGEGNDSVSGLGGDDTLDGGTGNDTLDGGTGSDVLLGGRGNDSMDGGTGKDILMGGSGNDTMDGGDHDDILMGESGHDDISGGGGNDLLIGGTGNDTMDGGTGNDIMDGGADDDSMNGGYGSDILAGGEGDDTLDGGYGNDTLYGGEGNDVLTGGYAKDVFVFENDDGADTITDFNPTQDSLKLIGAGTMDDIGVTTNGGNTIITFGETTITLSGVNMTHEEVWARVLQ